MKPIDDIEKANRIIRVQELHIDVLKNALDEKEPSDIEDLKDNCQGLREENKKLIEQIERIRLQMKERLDNISGFCGRYNMLDLEETRGVEK